MLQPVTMHILSRINSSIIAIDLSINSCANRIFGLKRVAVDLNFPTFGW